jgi:YjjG family noncanonical pyrimidine nucleotidase
MKYTWLLFDADDTLFDFRRSARHAFEITLEAHGIAFQEEHFKTYKSINDAAWQAFELRQISAATLRKIRFEQFLDAIGEYRDPLEMNAFYLHELSKTTFLIEGATALLDELRGNNHRLGLITNGLKEVQRPRILNARMGSYFEVIVVSDEIGVSKPYEGFFAHAFAEMGFPEKEKVLVVGDSLHSDIRGGNDYGVATCWYNPERRENLSGHLPTYEIDKLDALKTIVAG